MSQIVYGFMWLILTTDSNSQHQSRMVITFIENSNVYIKHSAVVVDASEFVCLVSISDI